MKKVLIILGSVIVVILLVIPLIFLVFKNDIQATAEDEINKQINGVVTFCDLHLSMLRDFPNLTIVLEDVVVKGKGEFASDTLARANELNIELQTMSLVLGSCTEIKSVNLVRPVIHLEILKDGNSNYMNLVKLKKAPTQGEKEVKTDVTLALDEISIEEGKLIYDDFLDEVYLHADGLHYTGRGDFRNDVFDLKTKTEIKNFTFEYGKVRYMNNKQISAEMVLSVDMAKQKYILRENTIQINHFTFGLDGSITMLQNAFDIDVTFNAKETSFKNIMSLVPGVFMDDFKTIKTSGDLSFAGFVKGRYAQDTLPPFEMNMKIKDAMFKIDTLPSPVENIQVDLMIRNNHFTTDSLIIDLRNIHADMMNHPIHGRFMIKGSHEYLIDADLFADMDLDLLEKMYPIRGLEMKGKLKGELKAKGHFKYALSHDSLNRHYLTEVPVYSTNIVLSNARFKYDSLPRSIDNVDLQLYAMNSSGKLENNIIDIKNFHLDFDKNPIQGYLKLAGYKNYTIDADIKAALDLEDIEKIFPLKGIVMKGLLDVDVEAKGNYNSKTKKFPMLDAKLSLKDGFLKTTDMPEPLESIHFLGEAKNQTGNWRNTNFSISQLTYTLENEPFEVKGSLNDLEDYNYDLYIKGQVDLNKLSKVYPVNGFEMAGIIDTDMEAKGSIADIEAGRYSNIKSSGNMEVKGLKLKGVGLPETLLVDDALFNFTPTKIVLERFKGEFGKSHFTMTGDLSNYMSLLTQSNDMLIGDLKLTCDTLDLNEWNKPQPSRRGLLRNKPRHQAKTQQLNSWMVPRNVNFTFDSDIGHLEVLDMDITHLKGEIKINDGVLSMHETGFNSLEASFNISGDYDTRNTLHPLFDFELDIKELDINKAYKEIKLVRDLVPAAEHTFGQLSVDYQLKGELTNDMKPKTETLIGGGEIQIANAKINGMKIIEELSKAAKKKDISDPHLHDLVVKSEIRNNKLFVKPFTIKLSGLNTDIEGVSDINGAIRYIVQIELLPIEKLKIPFHVTGTYDNPKVAIGKGHKLPEQ